jgi:hypothetical protein
MRWVGHESRKVETRNAYKILAGKPEGKRPLLRPNRRWEDNRLQQWILRNWVGGTEFIWIRTGSSGGLL